MPLSTLGLSFTKEENDKKPIQYSRDHIIPHSEFVEVSYPLKTTSNSLKGFQKKLEKEKSGGCTAFFMRQAFRMHGNTA
jgi:hypothetical protein